MENSIKIDYICDPKSKEEVFKITISLVMPEDTSMFNHEETRDLILKEYEKMDVLEKLKTKIMK